MTPHEVLQLRLSFPKTNHLFLDNPAVYAAIIVSFFLVVVLLAINAKHIQSSNPKKSAQLEIAAKIVFVSMFLAILVATAGLNQKYIKDQTAYVTWVEETLLPHAETLIHTDRELVDIQVQSKDRPDLPPEVTYKNADGFTETLETPKDYDIRYGIRYDVPVNAPEYVRFYEIPDELDYGFTPGEYGLTVHLHEQEE